MLLILKNSNLLPEKKKKKGKTLNPTTHMHADMGQRVIVAPQNNRLRFQGTCAFEFSFLFCFSQTTNPTTFFFRQPSWYFLGCCFLFLIFLCFWFVGGESKPSALRYHLIQDGCVCTSDLYRLDRKWFLITDQTLTNGVRVFFPTELLLYSLEDMIFYLGVPHQPRIYTYI